MNIKALRETMGITQQRLADDTGIDRALIARYENGTRKPPIDNIIVLATYFNVSTNELIGVETTVSGENTPPRQPTNDDIKFALFGGDAKEISDEQLDEVKRYAQYLKERKKNGDNGST